jgi:hypothetical protein
MSYNININIYPGPFLFVLGGTLLVRDETCLCFGTGKNLHGTPNSIHAFDADPSFV